MLPIALLQPRSDEYMADVALGAQIHALVLYPSCTRFDSMSRRMTILCHVSAMCREEVQMEPLDIIIFTYGVNYWLFPVIFLTSVRESFRLLHRTEMLSTKIMAG